MNVPTSTSGTVALLEAEFARLHELGALEPDWDTYGSPPPSPTALATARRLLVEVVGQFGAASRPRAVLPLPGGGAQVDWGEPARKLSVEIGPQGDLAYLLVETRGTERKSWESDDASWSDVLAQIGRLLRE